MVLNLGCNSSGYWQRLRKKFGTVSSTAWETVPDIFIWNHWTWLMSKYSTRTGSWLHIHKIRDHPRMSFLNSKKRLEIFPSCQASVFMYICFLLFFSLCSNNMGKVKRNIYSQDMFVCSKLIPGYFWVRSEVWSWGYKWGYSISIKIGLGFGFKVRLEFGLGLMAVCAA